MLTLPQFFFIYFALAIIFLAGMAVNVRNPVHSVLLVLAMFFHMAGVYLMLNAEFLAAVQVIVYAGAVLVLYLFVVFLVNIKEEIRLKRFIGSYTTGRVITIGMLATLLAAAWSFKLGPAGTWSIEAVREITHTRALGIEMFSHYMLPFEIAGVILLVAVVGGMALAKKDRNRATTTEERRALMRGEELGE